MCHFDSYFRVMRLNQSKLTIDYLYAFEQVTVPEGRNRDRLKDMLIVRDNGASFKIIPMVTDYHSEYVLSHFVHFMHFLILKNSLTCSLKSLIRTPS